jgi:serine/threonine-protein kinase
MQQVAMWIIEWVVSMTRPSVVPVPDVSGQVDIWARHTIRMQGLRARAVAPDGAVRADYVRTTDPPPGTRVKRGTVVTMYLVPGDGGYEYA